MLGFIAGCGAATETEEITMEQKDLRRFTQDLDAICALFPKTTQEVEAKTELLIHQAKKGVAAIIAIPDHERTFDNTIRMLDTVSSNFSTQAGCIGALRYVSPDDALRAAVMVAKSKIAAVGVDLFGQNLALYNAINAYYMGNAKHETLTPEERYMLDEEIKGFKRSGMDLPEKTRNEIAQLKKELSDLSTTYQKNIDEDNRTITATRQELAGLDDEFVASLKRTDDGLFILGVDTPTLTQVMEHCTVQDTRKRLSKMYNTRAYPVNMQVLNDIILKRDQLAQLLGYQSYAHLDIDDEMAKTPETAQDFIETLLEKAQVKADLEFKNISSDLAPSVTLSPNGKLYPWDAAHTISWFKKKHYQLDERQVSEYFPMQQTIDRLLGIYESFFDLVMVKEPINCLWVSDLTLIKVYTKKDSSLIGYLILDLHPRKNKYGHACQIGVSPALIAQDGSRIPALTIVIANFPQATAHKPALLTRDDVRTFFHEFGHAMHSILGATRLSGQAGTRVKTDFVEMPSQMLEEWMSDRETLKHVSGHYQTGAPLPDSLLDTFEKLKNFTSGRFVMGQINYALLALGIYGPGGHKDTDALAQALSKRINKNTEFDPENHYQAAFGHLTGYGAKYYGYMWSKVYALDMFEHIKKFGLLNPEIGTQYAQKVLGKGGSKEPIELIEDFLGRAPNEKAFLKDLGL